MAIGGERRRRETQERRRKRRRHAAVSGWRAFGAVVKGQRLRMGPQPGRQAGRQRQAGKEGPDENEFIRPGFKYTAASVRNIGEFGGVRPTPHPPPPD